jgi:hypothetical protein
MIAVGLGFAAAATRIEAKAEARKQEKQKEPPVSTAQLSRHDVEAKIVKRCWDNDAFRKEFLSDPAGCFVKYLNAPKAQLPKIIVHQEQPGTWHIVMPAKPAKAGELSDEELEKVAGGTDVSATVIMGTMFTAAAGVTAATVTQAEGNPGGW